MFLLLSNLSLSFKTRRCIFRVTRRKKRRTTHTHTHTHTQTHTCTQTHTHTHNTHTHTYTHTSSSPLKSAVSVICMHTEPQKTFQGTLGTQDLTSIGSKTSHGPSMDPTGPLIGTLWFLRKFRAFFYHFFILYSLAPLTMLEQKKQKAMKMAKNCQKSVKNGQKCDWNP